VELIEDSGKVAMETGQCEFSKQLKSVVRSERNQPVNVHEDFVA
jgi:hypothetical protein